jgi:nicotinamidase-related amidase
VTEQYTKGLGPTIAPVREALGPDYKPLEKMSFSCAGDAAFLTALDGIDREQILLCGIETHVCVYQTAIDLLDRGYRVYLVAARRTTATSRSAASSREAER